MYSREQIEKVRAAVDIIEIIREYVPSLNLAGRSAKGLCPFHNERTLSFHVQPEKGFFKCFGCGEAGDVITFICKMEQIGFSESLEKLAGQVGIQLKKDQKQVRTEAEGIREKIFRALEVAKDFYVEHLWVGKPGEVARRYLEERRVLEATSDEFQLGFAPSGEASCFDFLIKKGFAVEICQQAGLAVRSQAGRFYDPLFGRLVFPIFDSLGHVVGFGGRVLPEEKKKMPGFANSEEDNAPKYLNSPDTPVFSKGRMLYGLHQAKQQILSSRCAIILEGYMDVIGLHQGGFKSAVATLGTALTQDHAKVLKRYADEALAFFDADEAGRKASLKGLEPLLRESIFPRVVYTSEMADPDELLADRGKEFFQDLLKKAPDFVDYMLQALPPSGSTPLQQRAQLAAELLSVISASPNDVLKSEWTGRVARTLGISVEALELELNKIGRKNALPVKKMGPVPSLMPKAMPSVEEECLQLIFNHSALDWARELQSDDFSDEKHKRIFNLLIERRQVNEPYNLPSLIDASPESDQDWLIQLFLEERFFSDPEERKEELIRDIRLKGDKKRLMALKSLIALGQASPEAHEEYKILLRRIKGSSNLEAVPF